MASERISSRHGHHLVQAEAALVASPLAARATDRLVGLDLEGGAEAGRQQDFGCKDHLLLAVGAEHAGKPLSHDGVQRRGA